MPMRGSCRLLRGLTAALLCASALTSCGGGDEPEAEPTPTLSVTPTPTPTETPTTAPEPEAPELPDFAASAAGQEAFARYVVQAWAYALATNDAGPLTRVGPGAKGCAGCPELVGELAKRTSEGWSVYPFEVVFHGVELTQSTLGTTARVTFDVPETKSFFDDGRLRDTRPPATGAVFTVSMRVEGEKAKRAYQLIGFTVDQG